MRTTWWRGLAYRDACISRSSSGFSRLTACLHLHNRGSIADMHCVVHLPDIRVSSKYDSGHLGVLSVLTVNLRTLVYFMGCDLLRSVTRVCGLWIPLGAKCWGQVLLFWQYKVCLSMCLMLQSITWPCDCYNSAWQMSALSRNWSVQDHERENFWFFIWATGVPQCSRESGTSCNAFARRNQDNACIPKGTWKHFDRSLQPCIPHHQRTSVRYGKVYHLNDDLSLNFISKSSLYSSCWTWECFVTVDKPHGSNCNLRCR